MHKNISLKTHKNICKMNILKKATLMLCCAAFAGAAEALAQEAIGQTHILIAHRGGKYEVDENTIDGFSKAYAAGVRAYETDFRMTKDGVVVINHDATLKRMFNVDKTVESMTIAEVRELKTAKGNPLPTAEEFFDHLADKDYMYVECEMKTDSKEAYYDEAMLREYCKKLYETAMRKKPEHSVYVFTSFDKRPLRIIRELFPDAKTTYITGNPIDSKSIIDAIDVQADCLAGSLNGTTRNNVILAHKAKLKVSLWQTDSPDTWLRAAILGADYATCDAPAKTLRWLEENCKWIKYKLE